MAFLALRAGRPASVAELIDALWGDEAPVTAVKSLQSYVARARSVLGREVLVAAADGYQLTISPDDVDVVRFERALESVRALRAEGRLGATVSLLDDAAALWRGAPDVELPESEVARAEAVRLGDLTPLSHHFAEAAPAGEHDRAIHYTLAAAAQATRARAFDEAVTLHQRAIELLDDSADDDPTRRCDLVLDLARAQRLAGGDWRGAVAEAIDLARSLADGERLAQAALVRNKGWATAAFVVNEEFVALLE